MTTQFKIAKWNKIFTGYYGVPGEKRGGPVHLHMDGRSMCGARISSQAVFQWCGNDIISEYLECRHCIKIGKRIITERFQENENQLKKKLCRSKNGETSKIKRPIMRYPGGKFAIRRWVVSHFPAHQLFVDLYGGAGSVLMAKPRSQGEVYNDIDGEICDVFRVLRDPQQAAELARLLALTPYSRKEFDLAYEVSPDPIENSRRIIFRSFASHGSDGITRAHAGFRIRRNSQSGVTGANDWMNFSENIAAFSKRMQGVTIEQRPAIDLIRDFDKSTTLFYADPPYLIKTRSSSSVKYRNEITEEDHVRLADALHNIMGMAIISGYSSDLYLMLYKDWRFVSRSSRAGHAKPTIECMWLSPNIQTTLF